MQVKLGVIKSLRPMLSLLLPNDDLREQVYDYIPLLLAEFQGGLEALFITQVREGQTEETLIFKSPQGASRPDACALHGTGEPDTITDKL